MNIMAIDTGIDRNPTGTRHNPQEDIKEPGERNEKLSTGRDSTHGGGNEKENHSGSTRRLHQRYSGKESGRGQFFSGGGFDPNSGGRNLADEEKVHFNMQNTAGAQGQEKDKNKE